LFLLSLLPAFSFSIGLDRPPQRCRYRSLFRALACRSRLLSLGLFLSSILVILASGLKECCLGVSWLAAVFGGLLVEVLIFEASRS
jgi:hypothetical protein